MKRRKLLLSSGSAILTGSMIGTLQKPVLGLDFELSEPPNQDPKNLDSVVVEFDEFQINSKYIDENNDIKTRAVVELNGNKTESEEKVTVENGVLKDISDKFNPIFIDGIDTSKEYIEGKVSIILEHPDISDSYEESFSVSGSGIPASVTDDPWGKDASWTTVENWDRSTGGWGNDWTFDAGNWSIVSNPIYNGHNVGSHVTSSSNYDAQNNGTALNYYPDPVSDRVRSRMRLETAKVSGDGYRIGIEVGYNNGNPDYEIGLNSRNNELNITSSSGAFEEKSKPQTWSGGVWYGVYFDHDGSNYECALCDENDNLLNSITGTVDLQNISGSTGVSTTSSATTTSDGNDVYWGTIEAAKNQTTYSLS
jgi:hypothetical protein